MGVAAGPIIAGLGAAAAGATAAQIFTTIFVNAVLTGLSIALAGKRKRDLRTPIPVTVRNTSEFRRIVFGETRVHGFMVYYRTSSPNVDDLNKYLWYVVVFAGHQVQEISDVWIDKVRIDSSLIDGGTGAVTATEFDGKMNIWKYLGTSAQTAQSDLVSAISSEWTTDHRLRGNAYIVIRMERDDNAYPFGAPQDISVLMKGAKCYDWREGGHDPDDPSTWEYTDNPILHAGWLITGGSVINDDTTRMVMYGLKEDPARIDSDFAVAAANICDESVDIPDSATEARYTNHIELSCGETRGDQLRAILASCLGQAIYVGGKWRLYAGAYDAPSHTLDESAVRGSIDIQDLTEVDEAYNQVTAVFLNSLKEYVEDSGPVRSDAAYITADGEPILKELDLRGVTSVWQVERIEEIVLRQSRNVRTIQFPGKLDLLKIAPWETFNLSIDELDWDTRVFRLIDRELTYDDADGLTRPVITARVESSSPYDDLDPGDYIGDSTSNTGERDVGSPANPSELVAVGQSDGILLRWSASGTPRVLYEVQESTASNMTSPTRVYFGADTQVLLSKAVTTTFYYRVRAIQSGGTSAWDPLTGGVPAAASAVSGGFRATASPSSVAKFGTTAGLTTQSTTVSPVNGTAPYTYAWTWASGGTSITTNSASAATTTFSVSGMSVDEQRSGIARCTVTDNAAATTTVDVAVNFKRVSSS